MSRVPTVGEAGTRDPLPPLTDRTLWNTPLTATPVRNQPCHRPTPRGQAYSPYETTVSSTLIRFEVSTAPGSLSFGLLGSQSLKLNTLDNPGRWKRSSPPPEPRGTAKPCQSLHGIPWSSFGFGCLDHFGCVSSIIRIKLQSMKCRAEVGT